MSLRAVAWCIELSLPSPMEWQILLRICNHYNDVSKFAYPSQERLGKQCQIRRENVNRHIRSLASQGLIEIIKEPNKVNKYRLPMLEKYVSQTSLPKMDVTETSHEDIIYNISDDITLSTNTSNNYKVDKGEIAYLNPRDKLWKLYLPWLEKQKTTTKNSRAFLSKLINVASNDRKDNMDHACDELCQVFKHCTENEKYNVSEYLMASAKSIAKKKRPTKELSQQGKDMIEDWIDRIYRKSKTDNRLIGEDWDKIREAFRDAMRNGTTEIYTVDGKPLTTRGLQEYFLIK